MATSLAIRFQAEPIRSVAFGTISNVYMGIGTSINHPARQIYIVNNTDVLLMFSLDGVNDHFAIPAFSYFLNDITSNMSVAQGWYWAEGTRLYVKEIIAPSVGNVYFSVFYGGV